MPVRVMNKPGQFAICLTKWSTALMRTVDKTQVKRNVSATEASYEKYPLYHFYRCKMLERSGSTVTKLVPIDKYINRSEKDHSSLF